MVGFFLYTQMQMLYGSVIVMRAYADTVDFSSKQCARYGTQVWGPHMVQNSTEYFLDRLITLTRKAGYTPQK